jgi:hypothetical protein
MAQPPANLLRNTATLEAWRAYNRKANEPLMLAMAPTTILTALSPVMIALTRRNLHALLFDLAFLIGEVLALAWLIYAFIKVRAYKRAHPFVPPPPVTWSEKRSTRRG